MRLSDRYSMDAMIAKGGMAEVWTAQDEVLARRVAVKILLPELAKDEILVERFRREALSAARLEHPHIISIYDTGTDKTEPEPRHFIVMEYCSGGSLLSLLRAEGPLDPERVLSIGSTICDALSHAHEHGVIHRDVKPANVLITELGSLKVTDFGIAKAASSAADITATGSTVGTATYLAPELASGGEATPRSDLYSLGVLLYELLVGKPPFREATEVATAISHVKRQPPPPRSMRAGIPRDVEDAIMRALAKKPDERYASADEMRRALEGPGGSATRTFAVPTVPRPVPLAEETETTRDFLRREGKRTGAVIALVVATVVAAVIVGTIVSDRNQSDSTTGSGGQAAAATAPLEVVASQDFDPHGDGSEKPDEVAFVHDSSSETSWQTENYHDPLSLLKPGVGVLLDLGESKEVGVVEVIFDDAGYSFELRASDQLGGDETAFDVVETVTSSADTETLEIDTSARYWLVWLTELPSQGGRGRIVEVTLVGG